MDDMKDAICECSSDEGFSRSLKILRLDEPANCSSRFTEEGLSKEVGRSKRLVGNLFELFSMQFVDYKQLNPDKIYGMMMLNCAGFPYLLFERFPGDPLPVDSNGFVKLSGPSRAHFSYDRIEFGAFLSDLEGHVDVDVDGPPGYYLWNGLARSMGPCNTLVSKRWNTMFGPVEVNCAVFTDSAQVKMEFKLLDWKGKGKYNGKNTSSTTTEIEVFGEVTVRNKVITDDRAKSYLFKREKDMCALVRPGEVIPLSRHCTAFPIRSSIVLDMHLFHPSDDNSGGDDLILNGRVEIPATSRDEKFVLEGDYATIQLNLIW